MRIVAVALRVGKLTVSAPFPMRHPEMISIFWKYNSKTMIANTDQGFLTDTGSFVGREEAKKIARDANQLLPQHYPGDFLYSEDLF